MFLVCIYGLRSHVAHGSTAQISLYTGVVLLNLVGNPKVDESQGHAHTYKVLGLQVIVDHSRIVNDLQKTSIPSDGNATYSATLFFIDQLCVRQGTKETKNDVFKV